MLVLALVIILRLVLVLVLILVRVPVRPLAAPYFGPNGAALPLFGSSNSCTKHHGAPASLAEAARDPGGAPSCLAVTSTRQAAKANQLRVAVRLAIQLRMAVRLAIQLRQLRTGWRPSTSECHGSGMVRRLGEHQRHCRFTAAWCVGGAPIRSPIGQPEQGKC